MHTTSIFLWKHITIKLCEIGSFVLSILESIKMHTSIGFSYEKHISIHMRGKVVLWVDTGLDIMRELCFLFSGPENINYSMLYERKEFNSLLASVFQVIIASMFADDSAIATQSSSNELTNRLKLYSRFIVFKWVCNCNLLSSDPVVFQ